MKTDNPSHVGVHTFEARGLGKAPFRFIGWSQNVIRHADGSTQPAGTCDYCGTGIANECAILSADGKKSVVGCDCIRKVGDEFLLQAFKTSPDYRAYQRGLRAAKAKLVSDELYSLIEANKPALQSEPHSRGFLDRQTKKPLTRYDELTWLVGICGNAGKTSWLKGLKAGTTTFSNLVKV